MINYIFEKYIRKIFDLGVAVKGADGVLEVVGGILFLLIKPSQLSAIIGFFTQGELLEDPKDMIVGYLLHTSQSFSVGVEIFLGLYLITHGAIKIIIAIGLLKNKSWAYPFAIITLSLFVSYQMYQFLHSHAIGLLIVSAFDVVIIFLAWHEYKLIFIEKVLILKSRVIKPKPPTL